VHRWSILITVQRDATQSGLLFCKLTLHEIMWNTNLMQIGNFINAFLARHVSGTYAHHQERWMLCCIIWFSAPSFWMGGGLESRCVGRVCGADGALQSQGTIRTVHTTYAAAHRTTTHLQTRKTICCSLTSNAPDDGRMYPKHVELRILQ